MKTYGWKYRGTIDLIRLGDTVRVSRKYAKEFTEFGTVVGLQGFITVQFANGDKVDFYARSVSLVKRKEN